MVFNPQISTQVDELKTKVEETKSSIDTLTLMTNVLEKQRRQEEIEILLTQIESDLDWLETTLAQKQSIETDPVVIDLIHKEKQKIEEIRTMFLDVKADLDDLASSIVDDTSATEEEKWFFEKTWDGVTEQWDKLPDGVKTGAKVVWWVVTGVLIWKWVKKLFGRGDAKEKEEKTDQEENKPWYKKWYTWVAAGVLWFLGIKYGKEFMSWFESLFGGDQNKRDKTFETIANNLWTDYEYDNVTGKFTYKNGRKYSIEDLYKKWLIKTTIDADGNPIIDISATQFAIKEYIEGDTETQSNTLNDVDFTKKKWESLSPSARLEYGSISDNVASFTDKELSIDSKISGIMIYHLNEHHNNIAHLLNEKTFNNFMESTTTSMAEQLFDYMPNIFVGAIQSSAELSKSLWLHDVASVSWNFAEKLCDLAPEFQDEMKKIAIDLYEQWTDVSLYVLSVRNAYEESVGWDKVAMKKFDTYALADLYKESEAAKKDEHLQKALEKPLLDQDVDKRIERLVKKEKMLISDLEEEPTTNEVHEVLETLIDDIDTVWYNTWAWAFSMIWGHIWETDRYLEYDILEQQYEEYIWGMRNELKSLLDKDSYTSEDVDKVKQHVSDFHETMRKISTDVELRQETDADGDLYTRWKIPVVSMGETIYQTFTISMEEENRWLMWGTLASADLLTAFPRKIIWGIAWWAISASGIPFVGTWVRKLVWFSLTWKLAKITGGIWLRWIGKLTGLAVEAPVRSANRWINKYPWLAYTRFDTKKDIALALENGHIKLSDAAEILSRKTKWNRYNIDTSKIFSLRGQEIRPLWFMGNEWRKLWFGDDILQNKKILLGSIERLETLIPNKNSKDWDLLIKYRDNPQWSRKLRYATTWIEFENLMKSLKEFDVSGRMPSSLVDTWIDALKKWSIEDMTETIAKSKKSLESYTKKIFTEFDKELAEYTQTKWIKKWTKAYEEASRLLWNSKSYGLDPKLQSLITEHNDLTRVLEVDILKKFNLADWATKQKMVGNNSFLAEIVAKNWWIEKRKIPGFGKAGRIVSVGVHAVMLWWIGSGDNALWHQKSTGEIATDVADFGLWMIPVAWWLYDIGMAFRGKDLNGREMGTWERWVRWWVWLVTWVLDVFTFGLWWTAIRWVVKWWTKVAMKVGTKKLATESIEVASKWITQTVIKQTLKTAGRDILIWSAAGIALIPVFDSLEQKRIYDEE